MYPESQAPPLAKYEQFRKFMVGHGIVARRDYVPLWENPETGEISGGFWTVVIHKEEDLPDGRIYAQMIDISERPVMGGDEYLWGHLAELIDLAMKEGMKTA